jgi:peptidyl-prolyl cis-trans isomerase A (cyclophilin A)
LRKWTCTFLCLVTLSMGTVLQAGDQTVNVVMETTAGDILLELYPDAAPLTVANFLRHIDNHHYDGSSFYRTVRMDNQAQNKVLIEVIQGGLGMDDKQSVFDPIEHESTQETGIQHVDGAISMARLDPGSASSEFFICINDQPELDYGGQRNPDGQGFAAFGKVTQGMETVRAIQAMETLTPEGTELEYTSGQILVEPVKILTIRRERPEP